MAVQQNKSVRLPVLVISAICLLACCAVVSLVGRRAGVPRTVKSAFPLVSVITTIQAPGLTAARFCGPSNLLLIRRADGTLDAFSASGKPLYSLKLPRECEVAPAINGKCLMTYCPRNPANRTLTFFDLNGRQIWRTEVDGAVWCADACSRGDKACFAAGTGRGYVYAVEIGETTRRYRRWRMPGPVVSLAVHPEGDYLFAASWHKSAIRKAGLRGSKQWEMQAEPAVLHSVRLLPGSRKIFVEGTPVKKGEDGSYSILDDSGRPILTGKIDVEENTQVLAAPGGRFVCTGITRLITHQGKSMWERHVVLTDSEGKVLWEKGSPFFQAVPLAVTEKGYAIISDGRNSIFIVSPSGEMRSSVKLQSGLRSCVASADASRLLANCRNGKLVLMNVSK